MSFIGITIRTNRIIASDHVLTSSCVIPTIGDCTGIVSDYPINKKEVLTSISNQFAVFITGEGLYA